MLTKLASGGGTSATLYSDDVFSAYTYTGNGATQTINNGIDLAGKGGMVWIKNRVDASTNPTIADTVQGTGKLLVTNVTNGAFNSSAVSAFNSNGFSLPNAMATNQSGEAHVAWTFRKAPKFFDVVTWSGNATNRTIAHSLGQEVGLIFVKRTDTTADWQVYHRSLANTEYMVLNTTAAKATGATRWNSTSATTSVFSVGTDASVNASGGTYVAYLFAHDASTDGLIQCGSVATNGTGDAIVNLGWEPQFVLRKASITDSWYMVDAIRGCSGAESKSIFANSSSGESSANFGKITPSGFTVYGGGGSSTYIYLAIRRPNKPPTTGTQVYNAIARTGTGADTTVAGVGFAPDLEICINRYGGFANHMGTRLRGVIYSMSVDSSGESSGGYDGVVGYDTMDGLRLGSDSVNQRVNKSGHAYIHYFFKRAPGVLDVLEYTGNSAVRNLPHALGVKPELAIFKYRGTAWGANWYVYAAPLGASKSMILDSANVVNSSSIVWNYTEPTNSVFTLGNDNYVNLNNDPYMAYLFASKAGISKVGSYTGNGSSQTINCGFTTGARFVLIKRTDSNGNWYVWDSVRGIVAANDPRLHLNTTSAEVTTDDSVDPDTTGFIVNQVAATNVNVTSATYIYLALA